MKYNDIQLTRTEYNKSASNKQGEFRPPLGFIKEQGWDAANITDAQLDQAFEVYKSSAFDDINAYHIQHPLRRIIYAGLNSDITSGLAKALICQINNALVNGLVEIVNTSSNSTSAFSQTIESTVKINTKGQIDQDTEDALDDLNYRQWEVSIVNGQISVSFGNMEPYVSKTMNGFALESMNFINDNPADLDFPSLEIVKKAIASNNKDKGFKGVWDAPSKADVDNIDAIFNGQGLTLTSGETITPDNTIPLETIIIEISSDDSFLEEEKFFDTTWKPLSFNNAEFEALQRIITGLEELETKVDTNEDNIAQVVQDLSDFITKQEAENTRLANLIATNTANIVAASNVANQALALANGHEPRILNNEQDILELNTGKFDINNDGTLIRDVFDEFDKHVIEFNTLSAKVPVPGVNGKFLQSQDDGTYTLVDPTPVDLTPYRKLVDQDVIDAKILADAKAYADTQIAAIPPVKNPLLNDYEEIVRWNSGVGTYQITDIDTKPNDFVAVYDNTQNTEFLVMLPFKILPINAGVFIAATNINLFSMNVSSSGALNSTLSTFNEKVIIYRRKGQ